VKQNIFVILWLFLASSVVAQQSNIREIPDYSSLASQVQDISRTRFIRGYRNQGDGGQGFFSFTNTIVGTNIGTRIRSTTV